MPGSVYSTMRRMILLMAACLACSILLAQDSLIARTRFKAWLIEKGSEAPLRIDFIRDTQSGILYLPYQGDRGLSSGMIGSALLIPSESIEQLEFKRYGGKGRGTLIGAGIGMGIGALTAPSLDDATLFDALATGAVLVFRIAFFTTLGTLTGLLVGGNKRRHRIAGSDAEFARARTDLFRYRPRQLVE